MARVTLDIPYGQLSFAQKLDIHLPSTGEGPFPVIIFVHGGAFYGGDKADGQLDPWLQALEAGYAVASVNYRLSGEALFPAGLQDIKLAIRFLRAHADQYRLDPERFAVSGDSAGGYFAAMVGLTAGNSDLYDPSLDYAEYPSDVKAVVDWYGPTDFLRMDEQLNETGLGPGAHSEAGSPESLFLGRQITEVPDLVQMANPAAYVHREMPPFLIQHGDRDDVVPCGQSLLLAEAIRRVAPHAVEFDILPNAGHGDQAFETPQNMARVFRFLDEKLG